MLENLGAFGGLFKSFSSSFSMSASSFAVASAPSVLFSEGRGFSWNAVGMKMKDVAPRTACNDLEGNHAAGGNESKVGDRLCVHGKISTASLLSGDTTERSVLAVDDGES